jgi:hypothetical protein
MLVKFFSLVTLICAVAIGLANIQNSSDPLFFIVTGGWIADIARIGLAALMVVWATFAPPKTIRPQAPLLLLGVLLVGFGVIGFFLNSFNYSLYNYVKPLDCLMLAEAGIVSSLVALEANKPMVHFYDPYRRVFTIAALPKLKKIKTVSV